MLTPSLQLDGFSFSDLYQAEKLTVLDQRFLNFLKNDNAPLYAQLCHYREAPETYSEIETSELLLHAAPVLEKFLSQFFKIESEIQKNKIDIESHHPIFQFKKIFILKKIRKCLNNDDKQYDFNTLTQWLSDECQTHAIDTIDFELAIATLGLFYLKDTEKHTSKLEKLTAWCVKALVTKEGRQLTYHWSSLRLPEHKDYQHLIPLDRIHSFFSLPEDALRFRDGFDLTDPRMTARDIQNEAHYCIYCHDHDGDFCSKGFPIKKEEWSQGFRKNPLEVTLTGCPLEQKISEMILLKRDGYTIAPLAVIMVDNPMCPITGHRICNDCMKSCIYQKQTPVNVPEIETRILTDVLDLPWGVEIYDLLTRWNPLRPKQWVAKPYNGLKIMIAGMGPAGLTAAHHLLMEGFAVVGFDGLKIEPLLKKTITEPIYQFETLKEKLDERVIMGFGGVAEYGITSRWDKNFLKLIYINLMRRPYFQVFGNVRFGGTVTVEDAWEMGFDHFIIAVGAGLPKALPIPGSLAPGMRQASDFLMALQLTGAAKKNSLAALQMRLPAVVIGGGLTGVDTATEAQAYYVAQVEKFLYRYELLLKKYGETIILKELDAISLETLYEFLSHGKAIREERARAAIENRQPNFIALIRAWGGVTIVTRRSMQESPAYINNHEELKKALEEGIYYQEGLEPASVGLDIHGHVQFLSCIRQIKENNEWKNTNEIINLSARSLFVATGTQPNVAYAFEHPDAFERHVYQYHRYENKNGQLEIAPGITHCKVEEFGPFTSYNKADHRVSLIGDTHPVFHGSVVKAVASGSRIYPKIIDLFKNHDPKRNLTDYSQFSKKISDLFESKITDIKRCADHMIEITIYSPLAAKKFKPGQFYRLQNYECDALRVGNTTLQTEALALLGIQADKSHVMLVVVETGASSRLCATFTVGQSVALMGPTGARSKISYAHETVLIVGGQLAAIKLRAYGALLREAGNKVVYISNFETADELYCQDALEKVADFIIWSTRTGDLIKARRPHDVSTQGECIDIIKQYAQKKWSDKDFTLESVDRIFVIGDSTLLRDFQQARENELKSYLVKNPRVFGSVYSSMQCMLKGVCAQCLQWQIDPETKKRTKAVFACSWQHQPLEIIDVDNIDDRQQQNKLQEHINNKWLDYLMETYEIPCI